MSFWDIFQSSEKKKRLSHIRNIIAVMAADGKVQPEELAFLMKVGKRWGISEQEIQRILKDPASIKFYVPKSNKERIQQMLELTMMMMVDGDIDATEMMVCKAAAVQLGFKPAIVDKMIKDIIEIVQQLAADDAIDHIQKTFGPSLN